ncbi:hypothetical protein F8S13_16775 [Chloroflexia bacterium SDU3-3]|nr:hypothetical protein F8S13_16775 [Chloroflexia bacterium SDU3-3]
MFSSIARWKTAIAAIAIASMARRQLQGLFEGTYIAASAFLTKKAESCQSMRFFSPSHSAMLDQHELVTLFPEMKAVQVQ